MAEPLMVAASGVEATPFEIPGSSGQFRIQILNEDAGRGVVTSIVHIPAGGVIPAHFHEAGAEMHYVLEGDLVEHGERLGPGAFLTHAKGVVHGPHSSEGGAKVLTVQEWQSRDGNFDFRLAEGAEGSQGGGQQAAQGGSQPPAQGGEQSAPQGGAQSAQGDAQSAPQGGDDQPPLMSEGDQGPGARKQAEEDIGRGYG